MLPVVTLLSTYKNAKVFLLNHNIWCTENEQYNNERGKLHELLDKQIGSIVGTYNT